MKAINTLRQKHSQSSLSLPHLQNPKIMNVKMTFNFRQDSRKLIVQLFHFTTFQIFLQSSILWSINYCVSSRSITVFQWTVYIISSYLEGRKRYVVHNEKSLKIISISSGVLQGSVLGLLHFLHCRYFIICYLF